MGFVLDEWIGVTIPKTVFIQNARLGCVDFMLKGLVIVYVVITFFTSPEVTSSSYVPRSLMTVWPENGNFKAASLADMQSDMCDPAKNDKYDYWYDAAGGWSYSNATCVELGPRDRAVKTSRSIYVPTYVDENFMWTKVGANAVGGVCSNTQCQALGQCPGGSTKNYTSSTVTDKGRCLCTCSQSRQQFATGAGSMNIVFSHLPTWESSQVEKLKTYGVTQATNLKEISMATVIRDQNKKEWKRFEPGEDIRFTVTDALNLAGGYHLDDARHDFTFQNYLLDENLPADYKAQLELNPHLRITGVSVDVQVSYFNQRAAGHLHDTEHPICYIDVHVQPKWTSNPVGDYFQATADGEDEMRSRYYYGVLVTFTASGSYEFFDLVKFFSYLATSIVYLSVPNMLMVLFTKFCLGTLSEIYYKAQCQLLDTWELFSGQICRGLVGMVAYHKIAQVVGEVEGGSPTAGEISGLSETELAMVRKSTGGKPKVLDWSLLRAQLLELFEGHDCLDPKEIDMLECVLLSILEKDGTNGVSQKSFVEACVNSDVGSLKGWATLYDKERTPCFMEKLFDTQAGERRRAAAGKLKAIEIEASLSLTGAEAAVIGIEMPPLEQPANEASKSAARASASGDAPASEEAAAQTPKIMQPHLSQAS